VNFWALVVHDSLPSTSDFCIDRARAGEPEGLAVLARRQTRGRGSRGRIWQSSAGDLSLSVLLRPGGAAAAAGCWALLAGLVLAETLARFAPDPAALRLKWPNDVLLDERKLGGVLIDSAGADRLDWLVIGFGANLAWAPDIPDRPTTCLAALGPAPEPEAVAEKLLTALAHWRERLDAGGFASLRAAWLARAHPAGTALRIQAGDREIRGAFAGLTERGTLLLSAEGRLHEVAAGEVLACPPDARLPSTTCSLA